MVGHPASVTGPFVRQIIMVDWFACVYGVDMSVPLRYPGWNSTQ
jgi:hypothetical protein